MAKAQKRTVFIGTFNHSVDEKRRVSIPFKWRAAVKGAREFYVLPSPDGHLYVVPESGMEKMLEKADEISIGEYGRRDTLRLLAGAAHESPCDSQGRISLTEELLRHAGIGKDAVMVGALKAFEIWSPERLEEVRQKAMPNFAESAKQLGL